MDRLYVGLFAAVLLCNGHLARAADLNHADRHFLKKAGGMGYSQAALAQVGAERGSTEAVRAYARQVLEDHAHIAREVTELATRFDVRLREHPSWRARHERDRLLKLSGADFDEEFLTFEAKDLSGHLDQFRTEISEGEHPDVQAVAKRYAPVIEQNRDEAERLLEQAPETATRRAIGGEPSPTLGG